VSLQVMSRQQI